MTFELGARLSADGTTFTAYATEARDVAVRLFDEQGRASRTVPLERRGDGVFARTLDDVREGALYKLVLDGDEVPDPYARFLPFGVHGPARVVRAGREDALSEPPPPHRWTIYELHVGTFSPEGTYRGVLERLDAIADLGVTAIELLPVAAFAGARGWGYDGAALFAPFAPYGEPDDLRALVRAAHARGIAVVLDVVYNHLGPSGNYLGRYANSYFTSAIHTPWGAAPDFSRGPMRRLVIENARYWLEEFGFDALRLDATHAIVDPSDPDVVADVTAVAHEMTPPRRIFLEDDRNDPEVLRRTGADAVWADDLHHQIHTLLTGERDGYYAAYEATLEALAECIHRGWTYTGQPYAPWEGRPRGAPIGGLGPEQLVTCVQNHDQVGNRAFGTRLSEAAGVDRFALATMLLLFLPTTPVLFMGQEWAASTPFLFFSDHEGELGEAVTRGRRKEFASFAAFHDPERIPDPQAPETFLRSKLRWDERARGVHARVLDLHKTMLRLRREDPVLGAPATWTDVVPSTHGDVLEVVRRHDGRARRLVVSFDDEPYTLEGSGRVLASWGDVDGGCLGPRSAVVLDAG